LREALAIACGELSEEGGLVETATLRRFGLAEHEPGRRLRLREPVGWRARVLAALTAGVLVLVALERLGPDPPTSSLAAAGAAALAVGLLPRLGWLAAAAALVGWLGADEPGTALVVGAALAAAPLLLPRAGALWSVPALAPALGAIGLAPAYPALAAFAPSAWRRAGLGAVGFLWLVCAEILSGRSLLYGVADGTAPRARWDGSLTGAAEHAVLPLLSGPALAPIAVFAGFAVLLPLAVRGRSLVLDVVLGAAWAAALAGALRGTDELLATHVRLATARGSVVGALLGATLAVAAAHVPAPAAPRAAPTLP
jgi:hypothetical protein